MTTAFAWRLAPDEKPVLGAAEHLRRAPHQTRTITPGSGVAQISQGVLGADQRQCFVGVERFSAGWQEDRQQAGPRPRRSRSLCTDAHE